MGWGECFPGPWGLPAERGGLERQSLLQNGSWRNNLCSGIVLIPYTHRFTLSLGCTSNLGPRGDIREKIKLPRSGGQRVWGEGMIAVGLFWQCHSNVYPPLWKRLQGLCVCVSLLASLAVSWAWTLSGQAGDTSVNPSPHAHLDVAVRWVQLLLTWHRTVCVHPSPWLVPTYLPYETMDLF